jgi:hypothetical protein
MLRDHDVLALEPSALLVLRAHTGVGKESGGEYERRFLALLVAGADGRLARIEWFDADREAEALARFDALAAAVPPPRPTERRVRPNHAFRLCDEAGEAIAARDERRFASLLSDDFGYHHQSTGVRFDKRQFMTSWRSAFSAGSLRQSFEVLATLGESLALARESVFVGGLREDVLEPFGPAEVADVIVVESDRQGRATRIDVFAPEHLGDAIARLYERYAELLPEGPERERATQAARSQAALVTGSGDLARLEAAHAPDFEAVDHRRLGLWSGRAGSHVERLRSWQLVADDVRYVTREILALAPDALLAHVVNTGTDRVGGGDYERPFLSLSVTDDEGRLARLELFDVGREAEALARFDALADGGAPAPAGGEFENAASRAETRLMHCFNARDWPGVLVCIAPQLVFDERRRMTRNTAGREVWLEQFRLMFDQPASHFTTRLLATRGERLSLHRHEFGAEVAGGGGPLEMEPHFALHEVDAEGRIVAIVLLDLDDEAAAYAELDARFEAGELATYPHALALSGALSRALETRDWDAIATLMSPHFVQRDHRRLVWASEGRDAAGWLTVLRSLTDLAPDTKFLFDHARFCEGGALVQTRQQGSRDGGTFENELVAVVELDAEGRVSRWDTYDGDPPDAALARYEEIRSQARAAAPFENAATRAVERGAARVAARDWEGFRALLPPSLRYSDRTALGKLETSRDEWLAAFREQVEMTAGPHVPDILATRGERLALVRMHWRGAGGDVGESELDWLLLIEVDGRGDHSAVVSFEPGDLASAYRELDARYADCAIFAAVQRWFAAVYRRDREAFLVEFAPSFRVDDRRRLGFGTLLDSAEAFFRSQEALQQLAPDFRYRVDHFETRGRAFLSQVAQVGTREGGPFETPFLNTGAVDEQGRLTHFELYDVEGIDTARARFDALAAEAPAESPFANAATRAADRVIETWTGQHWELYGRNLPEGFSLSDRRRAVQLEIGRNAALEFSRSLVEGGRSGLIRTETLATRGERLALLRWRVEVVGGDVGESEIRHLNLFEVDERGALRRLVRWDDDALEAALAELDARFAAGEGAASGAFAAVERVYAAIYRRDRETFLAQLAPGFRIDDHRRLGWGGMLEDGEWVFRANDTITEMAPDFRYRVDHFAVRGRVFLTQVAQVGTHEGGPFESPFLYTGAVDESGRLTGYSVYDVEEIEAARARFDALAAEAPAEPPFANAAYRANQAIIRASNARDWASIESLAPSLVLDDRRRIVGVAASVGDNLRFWFQVPGFWVATRLLTTRGERLALHSTTFGGRAPEGGGEVESEAHLDLIEVDAQGRIVANLLFDIADEATAFAELDARFEAIDRSAGAAWLRAFGSALERRDWDAVAGLYTPDFVGSDHRLVGWGTLRGPVAFLESLRQMFALAPDARMRPDHTRAHERGVITESRWVGTREGGAFESLFVGVIELAPDGRALRADFYDPPHLPKALARFESLRPDPLRIPPNASTRANDRWWALAEAGDWDAIRALTEGMAFEDRRRLVRIAGGGEPLLADTRHLWESGWRPMRTLLATAGDRLSLERMLWTLDAGGQASEIEVLKVAEVDAAGRIVAYLIFDPSDRAAASEELFERWVRQGFDGFPRATLEFFRAWNRHDRVRMQALLPGDYVFHDHRRTGIGRIEGVAPYLDSLTALWELSPDVRLEMLYEVRRAPNAFLGVLRWFGTNAEAGEFEAVFLGVTRIQDERQVGTDLFEIDEMDTALARFEELSAQTAPSSSTRAR